MISYPSFSSPNANFQAQEPAGQDQRPGAGNWEKATNKQQRRLVKAYDAWGAKVRNDLMAATKAGATIPELEAIVDRHLPLLEKKVIDITTEGINTAARLSIPSMVDDPSVVAANQQMINNTTRMVREALIPKARESLVANLAKMGEANQRAVVAVFKPMRAGVAQYAGGFWEAIFENQKVGGQLLEKIAIAEGKEPPKVRWVLDKRAAHCQDSQGYFGCPGLAGEYRSWNDLPTVPAGRVTCRGNCRCHLEAFVNGKWQRGLS